MRARQNSTLRRYAVLAVAFPDVGIGLVGVALAFSLTVLTMAHAIGRTPVPTSTRPCQLSQRHGLNPSVLRFARFGEPIFNGIGSFEPLAPVIFSVIFLSRALR